MEIIIFDHGSRFVLERGMMMHHTGVPISPPLAKLCHNKGEKTSNIHSYNTPSSTSGKFYVKSSRLEIQNNSFSRVGVRLWNKIPSYLTNLPKKAFKRVLRKLLFDILKSPDY